MVNLIKPNNLEEALEYVSKKNMILFSGGTDLMIRHRARAGIRPDFKEDVLYIADLLELKSIHITKELLEIGAEVTMADILDHPDIPEYIKAPFAQVGSVAIRNKATLGGNIVNASSAGDILGMLYALDAKIICQSKHQAVWRIPIENFIVGPRKTSLKSDEMVIGVEIPLQNIDRFTFVKVGARAANAISKLSMYGAIVFQDDQVTDLRIAFGAMGPTIIRNREVELKILSLDQKESSIQAAILYERLLKPIDDLRSSKTYRKQVALNLLTDFIEKELIR